MYIGGAGPNLIEGKLGGAERFLDDGPPVLGVGAQPERLHRPFPLHLQGEGEFVYEVGEGQNVMYQLYQSIRVVIFIDSAV